jgi:hypothetical protein
MKGDAKLSTMLPWTLILIATLFLLNSVIFLHRLYLTILRLNVTAAASYIMFC